MSSLMVEMTTEKTLSVFLKILVIICTLSGNLLVILAVWLHMPLRSVHNCLLMSLSVTDILIGLIILPLSIMDYLHGHQWHFSLSLCDFWLTSDIFLCTASILHLCVIAVDRYRAAKHPLKYSRNRSQVKVAVLSLVTIYILSILISVPPIFGWRSNRVQQNDANNVTTSSLSCTLTDKKGYVIFSASSSFVIPSSIICILYVNICRITQNQIKKKRINSGNGNCKRSHFRIKSSKQTITNHVVEEEHHVIATTITGDFYINQDVHNNEIEVPSDESLVKATKCKFSDENRTTSYEEDTDDMEHDYRMTSIMGTRTMSDLKESSTPSQTSSLRTSAGPLERRKQRRQRMSREQRATRTIAVVLATFVICWFPFFIVYTIPPLCNCVNISPFVQDLVAWLGYLNSALNPLIYTVFNSNFNNAFRTLISRSPIKRSRKSP